MIGLEPVCVKCGNETVSLESVAVNHPGDIRLMCGSCRKTHFEPLPQLGMRGFLSVLGSAVAVFGTIMLFIAFAYYVELYFQG